MGMEYIAVLEDIDEHGDLVFTLYEDGEPKCTLTTSPTIDCLHLEIGDELLISPIRVS